MTSGPTVWLETLGCSKNQVDSDKVTSMIGEAGYRDATVALQAFSGGDYNYRLDFNQERWATAYDFPAARAYRLKGEVD